METSSAALRKYMLDVIGQIDVGAGSCSMASLPDFDYYAADYLEFAEMNLEAYLTDDDTRKRENELISCVSNLKRAIDNQIECFFETWNIRESLKKKNLGLEKRLSLLSDAGFFTSRTIQRFSSLRNKVEHDFRKPDVQDLEAMFDLVTALVAILQNAMSGFQYEVECSVLSEDGKQCVGYFTIEYISEQVKFVAKWGAAPGHEPDTIVEADLSSPKDFAYFFRVLVLLNQLEPFGSLEHVRRRLA